ncbi:MAG: flagellar hook-basal body complex protein FliE [Clostridiales bacterium]|jgi:flagellar hook-basal body complex protein FliE|nr:flagellar hook-basal body complex protein FliE [Clostridiales bacterium]
MTINTQDYPLTELGNISFKPRTEDMNINPKDTFGSVFDAALAVVNETNRFQRNADALQLDLAAGRTDNILSVLLAQEKAYSSLNFTVQVTNKIIESYREIMRMQI